MSRARKIWLWIAGGLLSLILVLFVAGIAIVRTDWFRNMVRNQIIAAVEKATGGRVEVGSFAFEWSRLSAQVRDFVIHGLEPANDAPLLRASLLQVDLKLLSPFKGFVDIRYLLVDTPQVNLIVYPDGRTNVPAPKVKSTSDKSSLETIVNLAIGRFDLRNGTATVADHKTDFNARGENLRALLGYNPVLTRYTGQIDIRPLNLNGTPVNVRLPVTLEKDRIAVANAQLSTAQSQVEITGALEHMLAPRANGHVVASLSLEEMKRIAKLGIPLDTKHAPGVITADVTAATDEGGAVRIQNARLNLGQSSVQASGNMKQVQFQSTLALGELGRLLRVSARPEGTARIGGNATIAGSDYHVTANLEARNVALRQGTTRLAGIGVDTAITADPKRIDLSGLRLAAMGGGFTGNASLEDMERFRITGNLHNFDIDQMTRAFLAKPLGYDGVISGPVQASGDVKNTAAVMAHAVLAIAPASHGVPVSGKLNVDYNGRADTVTLGQSYIALPHTRADLAGSLGQQIQVRLVSRDFADFRPLAAIPVTFQPGGAATVTAAVNGKLSAPRVTGQVEVTNFAVEGRQFTSLTAGLEASKDSASVSNGVLSRGVMQARFDATAGLHNWTPESFEPLRANVTVRNADMQDMLALAGQASIRLTGALTLDAHINGTIADPRGSAQITALNGTLEGEHFDRLSATLAMNPGVIEMPSLEFTAGPSRLDANATYRHAADDLAKGDLRVHANSSQVQLAQFQSLVKDRPGLRGIVALNVDANATINGAQGATVTSMNGNVSARGLEMEGKRLGDLTATANTAGSAIQYNLTSDFAGSTIRANGRSMLTGKHETTANLAIANLPIDRVLAVAGRRDIPVSGTFGANGQVSGTLDDPRASLSLTVANGKAYDEPFTRIAGAINYTSTQVIVDSMRVQAGASNVELTGTLTHPMNDFANGQVQFHVRSNQVQLSGLHTLQVAKPGVSGSVEVIADGAATLRHNAAPLFSTLNANLAAKGLAVNKKPLGDLTAKAETRGKEVEFQLNSDFARSDIKGSGRMELGGDYPVNARVTFAKVTYSGLSPWLEQTVQPFDALLEGEATVAGPMARTEALHGTLQLSKLEAHSVSGAGKKPRVVMELHNEGPVVVALDAGVVTVRSARIVGPQTTLALSGTASIRDPQTLNLRADGNIKLEALQAFDPDIFSSGAVTLNAAVTGSTAKPIVNGRLQLQNASFNMVDVPNGLSNATGAVVFNGNEAVIQNITGESGGGKITLSGYAGYGGPEMQFRVQVAIDGVHVAYPATVTTQADARLTLAGTTSRSLLSGTVTILDVGMHSHSDMGSVLSSAAAPPSAPQLSSGLLAGMRFDVKIETAPDMQFRTTLAQNLEAEANLSLRGTVDHPGMLGRVSVTQGEVLFFGSKYTIDQATVSFFNPQKVEPILSADLETTVQGVDVALSVSGPVDKMKLSYRSDPPLQFSEIISLLTSGKPPSSDPVLAAKEPVAPQQSFQQAGASTLLGQAVANPVSGRLQRLFGVSKLKIDPQITGASNTPQATLTLEQQISKNLTFTYIQDVTKSNPQSLRVEWAINPQWSAIAARDVNGQFDVDVFYKKRFW